MPSFYLIFKLLERQYKLPDMIYIYNINIIILIKINARPKAIILNSACVHHDLFLVLSITILQENRYDVR